MPPAAIASSETSVASSAAVEPVRRWCRSRWSRLIAWGNFGAEPNPPRRAVVRRQHGHGRLVEDRHVGQRGAVGSGRVPTHRCHQACGLLHEVVATVGPGVGDRRRQLGEAGRLAAGPGTEVGAAVEGLAVGGHEHGHRPAAGAGHRLGRLHVDRVDVGALLAVDLHVHEVLVHERGDVGVLERLVGHDVAPVARRVADRQQHRTVGGPGQVERLVAPREPVDGVVGVLAQVGAGLGGESVGHRPSLVPRCVSDARGTLGRLSLPGRRPRPARRRRT